MVTNCLPGHPGSAAAAVVIVALAAVPAVAAAAEQQDQKDDPPPVIAVKYIAQITVVTAHKNTSDSISVSLDAYTPSYSTG